ncbi:MAG: hypothetical protein EPO12_17280 [Aquabacterium sp.]|jgi:hypothetical protein|nr:MAG: hypothetical protein EPO12_17280 [Aquabacterium sp.]
MISLQARNGFDHLLATAIKGAFAAPGERCDVVAMADASRIKEQKVVMLTVSSYSFRVMSMLYFTLNDATKQHFAALNKTSTSEMDQQAFLDVISECGNICVGALNRELARHFPHIGMSTPNILDRHCVDFLQTLKAGYIKHFEVALGGVTLHASLCVCDDADLDFIVDTRAAEEESTGELEMF